MLVANDVMHVQLRHHVAERRDVELGAGEGLHQCAAEHRGLAQQGELIVITQLVDFADASASRHQDAPGILRVVHQQQAAQGQLREREAVCGQPGMQFEVHAPDQPSAEARCALWLTSGSCGMA